MERIIRERVDFTGIEKGWFDNTLGMLEKFRDELRKELAYPSCSDLLMDTEHMIECMNSYLFRYYK